MDPRPIAASHRRGGRWRSGTVSTLVATTPSDGVRSKCRSRTVRPPGTVARASRRRIRKRAVPTTAVSVSSHGEGNGSSPMYGPTLGKTARAVHEAAQRA